VYVLGLRRINHAMIMNLSPKSVIVLQDLMRLCAVLSAIWLTCAFLYVTTVELDAYLRR
jgi:hypothetical protein